jgi:cytochrome c-type biogenesis protein CcmI
VIALLVGAVLAVGALVYVLYPLFAVGSLMRRRAPEAQREATEGAIDALREIEFDRATGKLSDDDYAALKAEYTRTALVELRAREDTAGTNSALLPDDAVAAADAAEAAVLKYRAVRRACDTCGPRPEPDPAFCSSCGKYLRGTCSHCGATVNAPASRFCANCGSSLAA